MDDSYGYAAWVICRVCGRTGPECVEDTKEQAIAAAIAGWNHRPEEDRLRAENERLRDVLKQAREVLREHYRHDDKPPRVWLVAQDGDRRLEVEGGCGLLRDLGAALGSGCQPGGLRPPRPDATGDARLEEVRDAD